MKAYLPSLWMEAILSNNTSLSREIEIDATSY
jgi:hypothetical protein